MDTVMQIRLIVLAGLTIIFVLSLGVSALVTWFVNRRTTGVPTEIPNGRWRQLVAKATGLGHRVVLSLQRRRSQRATLGQLMALDDHLLKDIGVERAQVPLVARTLSERGWSRMPAGNPVATPTDPDRERPARDAA